MRRHDDADTTDPDAQHDLATNPTAWVHEPAGALDDTIAARAPFATDNTEGSR